MRDDQHLAIAEFFDAVDKLERAGVIRSSRFLGDIGEFLCADTFGTSLVDSLREPGHDGFYEGRRVQVKFNNSPTGNNINVGDPATYEELVVVVGPRSKLRERDHLKGEFRFYRFTSDEIRPWKSARGHFYCAKERLAGCASKHTIKTSSPVPVASGAA